MAEPIYPEFGNRTWNQLAYNLLQELRQTATAFAGPPEDPTYYVEFDTLMSALSRQRHGKSPSSTDFSTPEDEVSRIKSQDSRRVYLSDVMINSEHENAELPHPFDLERCRMALSRPWPHIEATSQTDMWWRLEVMSWYEDWGVMSSLPKSKSAVRKEARMLVASNMPGTMEKVVGMLRKGRTAYKEFREQRKQERKEREKEKEEQARELEAHKRVCGSRTCGRCRGWRRKNFLAHKKVCEKCSRGEKCGEWK
ncbi:uncharacterized protein H6S33_004972 [Morchella sextelata]|uniref:uncharacterized protein n=1 Tax=Morchella sextelata TaxID=1174677 RepID=UPI001D040F39|nr:uncharacterized protein H6S33_004972 [Morchella sextelata]KAH0604990.1 hypothetical protein H6S33_004972 [Morchella sextelata]